jgi:hypothetical protein
MCHPHRPCQRPPERSRPCYMAMPPLGEMICPVV